MTNLVVTCDVGTSGIKTCLYEIGETITLVAAATATYTLYIDEFNAEQEPSELWEAMCRTTREVMDASGCDPADVRGISFCSQMQSLVLVDRAGEPVRRTMSYMDQRAGEEFHKGIGRGLKIAGLNARKLLRSLQITGAVPASVKDPVWKYQWVRRHEPEVFARTHKWLDIKEFLILKCTGEFVMTHDSAFATLLYDPDRARFSAEMCRMFDVEMRHLPRIIATTDQVGPLRAEAAALLGLAPGTPVFGGGGDASLIGVGAGSAHNGDTHIYLGTSGWVSTVVQKRTIDLTSMIASIVGATPGVYNYFAELETAGKCLEWVRDHLALDEINIFLQQTTVADSPGELAESLYTFMLREIKDVPAGSNGVIFTPWLHGNRCPFEDPNAAGMFFNIRLDTGKRDLIHAVVEGICYHLRWQLESQQRKVATSPTIRLVGGGALAPTTCQTLADILGTEIQTVHDPQNVGALGAAITVGVGLGLLASVEESRSWVEVAATYQPDPSTRAVHQRNFDVFRALYTNNKKAFSALAGGSPQSVDA